MDSFYSIGIAQIVFSLILIGKKAELIRADKMLMLLLGAFGLELTYSWLNFEYLTELPNLILFPLLFGPLLYLYALLMTSEQAQLKKNWYWHLAPFGFYLFIMCAFGDAAFTWKAPFIRTVDNSWFQFFNFMTFLGSLIFYVLKITKIMKQHQQNVLEKFSVDSNTLNLSWIHYLTLFVFGGLTLFIIADAVIALTGYYPFESSIPLHISILVATYSLSFFGFRQEAIYEEQQFERYEKQPLNEPEELVITNEKDQLLQYLTEKKPYLIRNLTLQDLANELSLPAYRVSEIINTDLGKNFFTLINELRVEEAKQRILSGEFSHLTLSAIGFDSGFNSKSTFQALFKKYTGMTPSQFKKNS